MAISALYTSLLNKIKEAPQFKFVHIWNNQLDQLEDGLTYVFPFPCVFVEINVPSDYLPVGQGYSVSDLLIRIHIGHEEYDAGGGNFEENVNVFTYRDIIVTLLNGFQPTNCTSLMKRAEIQDYIHTNVYHYIIEFMGAFVDETGSVNAQNQFEEGIIEDINFEKDNDGNPISNIDIVTHIDNKENEPYRKFEL